MSKNGKKEGFTRQELADVRTAEPEAIRKRTLLPNEPWKLFENFCHIIQKQDIEVITGQIALRPDGIRAVVYMRLKKKITGADRTFSAVGEPHKLGDMVDEVMRNVITWMEN
jgi:hypothetical protein